MSNRCPAGKLSRLPHQPPGGNTTLVQCVLLRGHGGQHEDQFGHAWTAVVGRRATANPQREA